MRHPSFTFVLVTLVSACSKESPPVQAPSPVSSTAPSSSAANACSADADCAIHSWYCGGCTCLATRATESAPECPSKPVQCLVDPCKDKKPRCVEGTCTAAP